MGCDNIPLVGDGVCNDESNTPVCNYDGGDCCLKVINIDQCSECICYLEEFCATGFLPPSVGDGYCNDDTNIIECGFDGGDCCGSCINTYYCTNCSCIGNVMGNGVPNALVGDGYCNDETNNGACNYDAGDCCLSNVTTNHCSECTCYHQETCAAGFLPPLVGDGYCNDDTNIVECGYDGGDCCGSCINTDYCTNCSCIGNVIGNGVPNVLVGDGYCNDETNNGACNYDAGDCCLSNVITEYCS